MRRLNAAAFAPEALPPSLKLRRTAVALAEAGRRASPKLGKNHERRRELAEHAEKFSGISSLRPSAVSALNVSLAGPPYHPNRTAYHSATQIATPTPTSDTTVVAK